MQKQLPHVTLAEPDQPGQWVANQEQTTLLGTKVYEKLVALMSAREPQTDRAPAGECIGEETQPNAWRSAFE